MLAALGLSHCALGLAGKFSGIWPAVLGQVLVSFPPGLKSPNSTSAMADPPCAPGQLAQRIAGTFFAGQLIAIGRPFINTSTTGVPVAWIAWIRSSCRPGRSRLVRDLSSP